MRKIKGLVLGILAALEVCSLSGCQIAGKNVSFEKSQMDPSVVFEMGEEKCSVEEAKLYLCNYRNLYGNCYGVELWNYSFEGVSLEEYVKAVSLDELTRIFSMSQIAAEEGITLSKQETEKLTALAEEYYQTLTSFERQYIGVDAAKLTEFYQRYALADKMYRNMTNQEQAEVSDDEARVIRFAQIFVSDKETADTIAGQLEQNGDFAKLAEQYSQKENLEITASREDLPEAVSKVAFELDNGEISGVIAAEDGYYFIRCINKYEEELTQQNKQLLLEKQKRLLFENTYSEYTEGVFYRLNSAVWEELCPPQAEDNSATNSFFEMYENVFSVR